MMRLLSRSEYEEWTAKTRDARMDWWRQARFGMFVHFGLYSQVGRNEWVQTLENYPLEEYEKLADTFNPKPGAPREWAALAKKAGMKYMVLTTRHHEGFSLWDSKVNPYNSVNYGPKRDIVREFVDACREYDLRIGFYTSLMDWHHPDGWRAAFDSEARARFNQYILDLNTELLTQYGKIDILWFDVAAPMEHWEGWNSLEINQKLRAIQPDIIINNRSRLEEDFGTPEEHINAENRDWEACMTFNGISWGYVDSKQAARYSYNAQGIIRMLNRCASGGGNLLLNIGPAPDGSVPEEAVEPLITVGEWLKLNGNAVYGKMTRTGGSVAGGNGVCGCSCKGNSVYLWNWIWPSGGTMAFGGYKKAPKSIRFVHDGKPVDFEHKGHRIILKNLPEECPAPVAGITVLEMEFDGPPEYCFASYYPQLHGGREITTERL
ncbi:MAG TPA: alpha-L-fucosidase [Clostridiales bacterium]|nr:alpha-L-fucosidase [Clostridiales bacterium]